MSDSNRQEQPVEMMSIITPDDHLNEIQVHFDHARELLRSAYDMTAEVVPAAADAIAGAWGHIETYDQRMEERAAGLIAMLQKLEEQRNEQILLRQDLEREISDPHGSNHPKIVALVEKMREYADELAEDLKIAYIEDYHDNLVEEAEEYIEESTIDGLAEDITALLNLTHSYAAHDFINMVSGRDNLVHLNEEEKKAFVDLFDRASVRMREERKKVRESIFAALEKKEDESTIQF